MPWKETRVMDEKIQMISNWLSGEYSITEQAGFIEVSRKILYKWIERYEADQDSGLRNGQEDRVLCPGLLQRSLSLTYWPLRVGMNTGAPASCSPGLTGRHPERMACCQYDQ